MKRRIAAASVVIVFAPSLGTSIEKIISMKNCPMGGAILRVVIRTVLLIVIEHTPMFVGRCINSTTSLFTIIRVLLCVDHNS